MKNKGLVIFGIIIGIIVFIGVCCGGYYLSVCSKLVTLSESVNQQGSYVAAAYQERADLIPNLVSVVKGASTYESDTLKDVTNARVGLTNAIASGDASEMQSADEELTKSINVMVEAYPEITATQNYLSLQDQLEGSENRIRVARNYYSDAIQKYNSYIKKPIIRIIAKNTGYEAAEYFKASAGAEVAPTVSFN